MIIGENGFSVVLSAETAAYLEKLDGGRVMSRLRMSLRDGRNLRVSNELLEIRRAAMSLSSDPFPGNAEVGSRSPEEAEDWGYDEVGATEAADVLGLSSRAVRMACESGHLRGNKTGGRWRISLAALIEYRAVREQRRKEP